MPPLPVTPAQLIALWIASAVTAFGAAALLRKAQGLPFRQPAFSEVEVRQNWMSGRSSRGLLGPLTRLNNAMWFVLTRDALHVGAHFPFNVFVPSFLARLDLDIPMAAISSVVEKSSFLGHVVRIAYDDPSTVGVATAYVELSPRAGDGFADVLRQKARAARQSAGKTFA